MTQQQVILVTGAAGYWGSRMAARLADEPGYHVIGLDAEQPRQESRGLDFVQADIRNPLLVELIKAEGVRTVCHLAFVDTTRPSEAAYDLNVMGTTNLLEACAEANVHKVVLKSSTAVYGARPSNSAFLPETHALRGSKRYGYTRDLVAIETFCNGFRHRAPEMIMTILRFASIVGPTAETPMTRFLRESSTPSLLGFDPMMQIIHEDDVVDALAHAVLHDVAGVFNIAARDVLPLGKIRGLAGKSALSIFHPFAYRGLQLTGGSRSQLCRYVPIELDYLRYSWVADLNRMGEELDFEPRYTAEETLCEFAEWYRGGRYSPGSVSINRQEEQLRSVIEQRRQARQRKAAGQGGDDE